MKKSGTKNILIALGAFLLLFATLVAIIFASGYAAEGMRRVNSYGEVYSYLNSEQSSGILNGFMEYDEGVTTDSAATGAESSYSGTNLQENAVDEADIVKTDGKYIYSLSDNNLRITEATEGKLKLLSETEIFYSRYPSEMYLSGDRLYIIESGYEQALNSVDSEYDYYRLCDNNSVIEIYDISDRSEPVSLGLTHQNGYYLSSRMTDGVLYLVTQFSFYGSMDANEPKSFIPALGKGTDSKLVEADDIYINRGAGDYSSFLILSAIDKDGNILSDKCVIGSGSDIYCSENNIYINCNINRYRSSASGSETRIIKFALNSGNISYNAEALVKGTVLNQFSMSEKDGYFRIATHISEYRYSINRELAGFDTDSSTEYNNLYVLDEKLNTVGKLENIAPDERIYSVRYIDSSAYIVTFRQVDPLFSIDLSDPRNPEIKDYLKIPGLSDYLHPWADNMLLGFGRDANENTGSVGNLKLSMFDISKAESLTELDSLIIPGQGYSEASYNHKAIIADSEKNIIGFPGEDAYLIYSYSSESGFKEEARITLKDELYYSSSAQRGLYIDDYFYIVSDSGICSLKLSDYSLMDDIDF